MYDTEVLVLVWRYINNSEDKSILYLALELVSEEWPHNIGPHSHMKSFLQRDIYSVGTHDSDDATYL